MLIILIAVVGALLNENFIHYYIPKIVFYSILISGIALTIITRFVRSARDLKLHLYLLSLLKRARIVENKFTDDQKIVSEITENKDRILSNLKQKDVDTYCYIRKTFENNHILNNSEFQFKFKKFYIMNSAGLSDEWKNRFFELLLAKRDDLKYTLFELYKIPRRDGKYSVQFSFATKLLHTVNNENPIYDKMIGEVADKKVEGSNSNEKIDSCIKIFNFLNGLYSGLINDGKVERVISEFRLRFNVSHKDISDAKVLDFMMWSLGKIKQDLKKIQK